MRLSTAGRRNEAEHHATNLTLNKIAVMPLTQAQLSALVDQVEKPMPSSKPSTAVRMLSKHAFDFLVDLHEVTSFEYECTVALITIALLPPTKHSGKPLH